MSHELAGKVFLVTGATEGIGKAATRKFAQRGASVVLLGRNLEKTAALVAALKAETEGIKDLCKRSQG